MAWKVKYFQTARGDMPVAKFMDALDRRMAAKVAGMIIVLKSSGPLMRPPYSKKIGRDLYELRVKGTETVRILYTSVRGEYYLLHAFKKKSQKTPKKEIKPAIDRMKEIV